MYNDSSSLVTIDELCEILMIGKNTAYSLLKSGAIKSFKINRIWKIPRSSIDEYITKQIKKVKGMATLPYLSLLSYCPFCPLNKYILYPIINIRFIK